MALATCFATLFKLTNQMRHFSTYAIFVTWRASAHLHICHRLRQPVHYASRIHGLNIYMERPSL